MHSLHQPYFELYTQYKHLEKGDNTEVNGTGRFTKPKGIGAIVLDQEDNTGKISNIIFEQVYYFPGEPKLLVIPQKWARDKKNIKYE